MPCTPYDMDLDIHVYMTDMTGNIYEGDMNDMTYTGTLIHQFQD